MDAKVIWLFCGAMVLSACGGADPANALTGSRKTAQTMKVKLQMKGLADAVLADQLSSGNWPVSLDTLAVEGSVPPSDLKDPWGNDLIYAPAERVDDHPDLHSMGPDGEDGTADDIVHTWQ